MFSFVCRHVPQSSFSIEHRKERGGRVCFTHLLLNVVQRIRRIHGVTNKNDMRIRVRERPQSTVWESEEYDMEINQRTWTWLMPGGTDVDPLEPHFECFAPLLLPPYHSSTKSPLITSITSTDASIPIPLFPTEPPKKTKPKERALTHNLPDQPYPKAPTPLVSHRHRHQPRSFRIR